MRETLNDWALGPISKGLQIFIIIIDPENRFMTMFYHEIKAWRVHLARRKKTREEIVSYERCWARCKHADITTRLSNSDITLSYKRYVV